MGWQEFVPVDFSYHNEKGKKKNFGLTLKQRNERYNRDRAIRKPVTLDGVEFLRRFCLYVFPKRFVRIRRYGIYNPTTIRNLDLQFIPEKKPDI